MKKDSNNHDHSWLPYTLNVLKPNTNLSLSHTCLIASQPAHSSVKDDRRNPKPAANLWIDTAYQMVNQGLGGANSLFTMQEAGRAVRKIPFIKTTLGMEWEPNTISWNSPLTKKLCASLRLRTHLLSFTAHTKCGISYTGFRHQQRHGTRLKILQKKG